MISVIIPAFNAEKYLNLCIESVLKMKYGIITEIIVVDDGSTDRTGAICSKYKEKYPKLFSFVQQKNGGVSKARNIGIARATSEYIMFIDADDYVLYGQLCDYMIGGMNTDFLMTGFTLAENSENIVKNCTEYEGDIETFLSSIEKWMSPPFLLSPWGKVFRTDIIRKYNIRFTEGLSYGEDVIFVMNYLEHCSCAKCISDPGYCYIQTSNSLSRKFKSEMIDGDMMGSEAMLHLLKGNHIPKYEEVANRKITRDFSRYVKHLICSDLRNADKKAIFVGKSEKYNLRNRLVPAERSIYEKLIRLVVQNKLRFSCLNIYKIWEYRRKLNDD